MDETAVMTDPLVFRVNPALNPQDYVDAFHRDGVVQIKDFFEPPLADRVASALKESTYWQLNYADEKARGVALNAQDLAKLDIQRLWAEIIERASTGFSFVYLAFYLQTAYGAPEQAEHPLHKLVQFLNSSAFLDFGRVITGETGVNRVDAAATWYRPGDFLTLHNDAIGLRRAAYTLGFTRGWRPDWGGQLLFHDQAGEIMRGLMPGFNVFTLFKRLPHSVAQVAHYAKEPRLTISGWLLEPKAQSQPA
jgi:SM-20-related protein